MSKFVLISKDAMCTDYLPIYGNNLWETPNVDAIAGQGTIFMRHYTAAPSTIMSFYSMATSRFAHESGFDVYEKTYQKYKDDTIFKKIKNIGYDCHILWAENMMPLVEYIDYFGDDVEIHSCDTFRQGVGAHYIHDGFLKADTNVQEEAFQEIKEKVKAILRSENCFLWIHFPHVIKGQTSYGSDIELFDKYVGMIRKMVPDNCIAITADHGNMNGHKGKLCYGFDVYEPNIRVPLITPRIGGNATIDIPTSSVDLFDIIFNKTIKDRQFIYSDSAFKSQPRRKIAIIKSNFKYIYNKKTKEEELYDIDFDPSESFSLMSDYSFDIDRRIKTPSRELYYYPNWEKLSIIREEMRMEKERIWDDGNAFLILKGNIKDSIRPIYERIKREK